MLDLFLNVKILVGDIEGGAKNSARQKIIIFFACRKGDKESFKFTDG